MFNLWTFRHVTLAIKIIRNAPDSSEFGMSIESDKRHVIKVNAQCHFQSGMCSNYFLSTSNVIILLLAPCYSYFFTLFDVKLYLSYSTFALFRGYANVHQCLSAYIHHSARKRACRKCDSCLWWCVIFRLITYFVSGYYESLFVNRHEYYL